MSYAQRWRYSLSYKSLRQVIEHSDSTALCQRCDTDMQNVWDACNCNEKLSTQRSHAGNVVKNSTALVTQIIKEAKENK
jgi:hypothetical protein